MDRGDRILWDQAGISPYYRADQSPSTPAVVPPRIGAADALSTAACRAVVARTLANATPRPTTPAVAAPGSEIEMVRM